MYSRQLLDRAISKMGKGKAILITGPRQVGKTTLIEEMLRGKEYLFLNGDDPSTIEALTSPNFEQIKQIIGSNTVVFIDEAQRIKNIGLTLKMITDYLKEVQLIVSGSSSFELSSNINEPLTGRKWEFELFPISWKEYEDKHGFLDSDRQLENRLLYGMYPDVLNNPAEQQEVLRELVDSYLYRDILAYANIRKPEILQKLVQSLALQLGNEVSYNELSRTLGIDKNTINNYIDVLEQGYVVFRLSSFSTNLRSEIKRNNKIYFHDLGVRNAVIGNFSPLELRLDKGALWENFLITERRKQNSYTKSLSKSYFWRTKQQQEVDYVEENAGKISGFEFKWKAKKNTKLPLTFTRVYGDNNKVISRENFREFILT